MKGSSSGNDKMKLVPIMTINLQQGDVNEKNEKYKKIPLLKNRSIRIKQKIRKIKTQMDQLTNMSEVKKNKQRGLAMSYQINKQQLKNNNLFSNRYSILYQTADFKQVKDKLKTNNNIIQNNVYDQFGNNYQNINSCERISQQYNSKKNKILRQQNIEVHTQPLQIKIANKSQQLGVQQYKFNNLKQINKSKNLQQQNIEQKPTIYLKNALKQQYKGQNEQLDIVQQNKLNNNKIKVKQEINQTQQNSIKSQLSQNIKRRIQITNRCRIKHNYPQNRQNSRYNSQQIKRYNDNNNINNINFRNNGSLYKNRLYRHHRNISMMELQQNKFNKHILGINQSKQIKYNQNVNQYQIIQKQRDNYNDIRLYDEEQKLINQSMRTHHKRKSDGVGKIIKNIKQQKQIKRVWKQLRKIQQNTYKQLLNDQKQESRERQINISNGEEVIDEVINEQKKNLKNIWSLYSESIENNSKKRFFQETCNNNDENLDVEQKQQYFPDDQQQQKGNNQKLSCNQLITKKNSINLHLDFKVMHQSKEENLEPQNINSQLSEIMNNINKNSHRSKQVEQVQQIQQMHYFMVEQIHKLRKKFRIIQNFCYNSQVESPNVNKTQINNQ